MKQVFTFFGVFITCLVSAQSLSLVSQDTLVIGNANSMDELVSHIVVQNNSNKAIDYKVKRLDELGYNGLTDSNAICWESCFQPNLSESPFSLTIEAGGNSSTLIGGGFSGHVYPDGDGEEYKGPITYRFFNESNPDDYLDVVVKYQVSQGISTGENALSALAPQISIYPNPVVGKATVEYSFSKRGQKTFELFNLLGSKVYERSMMDNEGSFSLDGSKFSKGVYFYVLRNNGKTVETRKIIFR